MRQLISGRLNGPACDKWCLLFALVTGWAISAPAAEAQRPNVILIMIDDMGYGDLSCHGSPFIKTPHLDALHASSVRLTSFHVAPMCSPTRGQLLTGLDAMRNGSTIVAGSRMMVRTDAPMLPAHFAAAGYATAIFGKWHLGENYPHRPQDRGFQETLWFPLQEIGSFSDYWCNDYFDPVLRGRDGKVHETKGYCTDILFDHALDWIQSQHESGRPYLCYLPLNVVHGPQWAPRELRDTIARDFPSLSPGQVGYLAMLANADTNVGRLDDYLRTSGQLNNTMVIFLSDNGGYALVGLYNAGMRDGKSRLAEGGHRVPCFVRWPDGGIGVDPAKQDVDGLTQVQDLLPTLLNLCDVAALPGPAMDGISLARQLRGSAEVPDRTLIVQYGPPKPFSMTCVMQGSWRLLTDIKGLAQGGPELYNLADDPKQRHNLIDAQPDRAARMRKSYDQWWSEVEPQTRRRASIVVGNPAQDLVVLNSAEWRERAIGSANRLREGIKRHGVWDLEVDRTGTYEVSLRRWPAESGLQLRQGSPPWEPRDRQTPDHLGYPAGTRLPLTTAHLKLGQQALSTRIGESDEAAVFHVALEKGPSTCEAHFNGADGKPLCAAFFVSLKRIDSVP